MRLLGSNLIAAKIRWLTKYTVRQRHLSKSNINPFSLMLDITLILVPVCQQRMRHRTPSSAASCLGQFLVFFLFCAWNSPRHLALTCCPVSVRGHEEDTGVITCRSSWLSPLASVLSVGGCGSESIHLLKAAALLSPHVMDLHSSLTLCNQIQILLSQVSPQLPDLKLTRRNPRDV